MIDNIKRVLDNEEFFRRQKIRAVDRNYFKCELGSFMNGKDIHHFWMEGERCLVLEKKEHHKLHKDLGKFI